MVIEVHVLCFLVMVILSREVCVGLLVAREQGAMVIGEYLDGDQGMGTVCGNSTKESYVSVCTLLSTQWTGHGSFDGYISMVIVQDFNALWHAFSILSTTNFLEDDPSTAICRNC